MQALLVCLFFGASNNMISFAPDVVPGSTSKPDMVAPAPFTASAKPAADDGLKRDKLNRKIGRLEAEVESLDDQLEQLGQSTNEQLIGLANKAAKAEAELREVTTKLVVANTIRRAAVARVVELEKEKVETAAAQSRQNICFVVGVMILFAVLVALLIHGIKKGTAILARLPSESNDEVVEAMGEEIEAAEEARLAAEALRALERERADEAERRADEAARRYLKALAGLQRISDEVIADMREELKREVDFRDDQIVGLRKRLLIADEEIAALHGGLAIDTAPPNGS